MTAQRLSSLIVPFALTVFAGDGGRDAGVHQPTLLPLTPLIEPTDVSNPFELPRLKSSVGNRDLETCVVNVIRQRVFRSPLDGGTVDVDVPLEFVSSPAH